ncbi:hypothetical protein V1525DRAFT_391124 [Lipomyces kononenkoae]|uniref:Uncharacterized protein n=1 Tax=Lipomyces kononenkoae TaxID=34357 RepID=A0ACC3SSZ1_LIPKO
MASNYAEYQLQGFTNQIRRVAIVGRWLRWQTYRAGTAQNGKHTVTALTRAGGQSKLPEGLQPVYVNYDDEVSLVSALEGQEFLIITLSVMAPPDTQSKLVQAAATGGIKYVMPNTSGVSTWLNKPAFISSFLLSQKDIFESWKRVTGDKEDDWTIEGFVQALYSRVFFPNGDGDFEHKYGLANSILGLLTEDLDEQTKNAKDMVDRGYNYVTNRN